LALELSAEPCLTGPLPPPFHRVLHIALALRGAVAMPLLAPQRAELPLAVPRKDAVASLERAAPERKGPLSEQRDQHAVDRLCRRLEPLHQPLIAQRPDRPRHRHLIERRADLLLVEEIP